MKKIQALCVLFTLWAVVTFIGGLIIPPPSFASINSGFVTGAGNLDTAGYVPFISSAGVLTINRTAGQQLFWDSANRRLGINNAAPSAPLDVTGTIVMTGANVASGTVTASSTGIAVAASGKITGNLQAGGNIPAVTGCGTIGTGSKNNAGFITTATGACVPVLTFANVTAATGWSCTVSNSTTPANTFVQTASSTTTATLTGVSAANDVIRYLCSPY